MGYFVVVVVVFNFCSSAEVVFEEYLQSYIKLSRKQANILEVYKGVRVLRT